MLVMDQLLPVPLMSEFEVPPDTLNVSPVLVALVPFHVPVEVTAMPTLFLLAVLLVAVLETVIAFVSTVCAALLDALSEAALVVDANAPVLALLPPMGVELIVLPFVPVIVKSEPVTLFEPNEAEPLESVNPLLAVSAPLEVIAPPLSVERLPVICASPAVMLSATLF